MRLGVRNFTLFDPDELSGSNVTRVYGSTAADIGKPKVDTLAAHLKRIAPDTQCDLVKSMITMAPAARKLCSCDIVFGCTDDNAAGLCCPASPPICLRPSSTPVSWSPAMQNGTLRGIDGRVTTLVPGQACLVCRGRIDLARAGAELLTPDERRRREEKVRPRSRPDRASGGNIHDSRCRDGRQRTIRAAHRLWPEPRPSEVLLVP